MTFSLEEMKNAEGWELTAFTYDLHHDVVLSEGNVMTEYEEKFSSIGNPICKIGGTVSVKNISACKGDLKTKRKVLAAPVRQWPW